MSDIRAAEERDALAIARVQVASWREGYRGLMPDGVLARLDPSVRAEDWKIELNHGGGNALVAVDEAEVVGFSYFSRSRDEDAGERVGEVQAIYVRPSHWRRGYGRALLLESLTRLRARGFETVTLWVLAGNRPAHDFYRVMGFHEDGARKEHGGTGLLELRYVNRLGRRP